MAELNIQDDASLVVSDDTTTVKHKPKCIEIQQNHFNFDTESGDVSSPKTPSSAYETTVIPECTNCPIKGFSLCYWDNIIGPRIAHVWKTRSTFNITRKLLDRVAKQTLFGELSRSPTDPNINTKYFPLVDHGVMVSSSVFNAANSGCLGVHSFSMLIPIGQRADVINQLCVHWMQRMVAKLKIFIEKEVEEVAMTLFGTQLFYMAQMLQSLREAGLPRIIPICDTLFHWEHRADRAFMTRAVTAHLITGGHSLVIGPSASQVNLMISTLALFLPEKDRLCCRYVNEEKSLPYQPELAVQGIVHHASGPLPSSLRDISLSTLPVALVDPSTRQTKISSYIHDHYLARHIALHDELNALWRDKSSDNYPTSDMFHTPDDAETLVTDFLDDMDLLPPVDGLREKFVDNFVRLLEKRAYALIKYIRHETRNGKKAHSVKHKKLRQDLSLTVPGDFKIVLAAAERLEPGIYGLLYKDRIEEGLALRDYNHSNQSSAVIAAFS